MSTFERSPAGFSIVVVEEFQLLTLGGAAAVYAASKEVFKTFNKTQRAFYKKHGIKPNDAFILIHQDLKNNMTKEQLMAVILHEEGHIVHGDHMQVPTQDNVFINQECELKADAYAIARTSKEALMTALQIMVEMTIELFEHAADQIRAAMQPRFDALEAM